MRARLLVLPLWNEIKKGANIREETKYNWHGGTNNLNGFETKLNETARDIDSSALSRQLCEINLSNFTKYNSLRDCFARRQNFREINLADLRNNAPRNERRV